MCCEFHHHVIVSLLLRGKEFHLYFTGWIECIYLFINIFIYSALQKSSLQTHALFLQFLENNHSLTWGLTLTLSLNSGWLKSPALVPLQIRNTEMMKKIVQSLSLSRSLALSPSLSSLPVIIRHPAGFMKDVDIRPQLTDLFVCSNKWLLWLLNLTIWPSGVKCHSVGRLMDRDVYCYSFYVIWGCFERTH